MLKHEQANLKFEAYLRTRCIELLGLWEGRLTTNRISDWFGVTRQAVSTDIKRYIEGYNPGSLKHMPGAKAYVAQNDMRPIVTKGEFGEFVSMIKLFEPAALPDINEFNSLFSTVDAEKFHAVLGAISNNHSLMMRYLTGTAPGYGQLKVTPIQLFLANQQPWLRAYIHEKESYQSLQLARIQSVHTPPQRNELTLPLDDNWLQTVQLRIQPNQQLPTYQQLMIEQTHNMPMGHATVRIPGAWVPFFLKAHAIAITDQQVQLPDFFQLQVRSEDWPLIHSILDQEMPGYMGGDQ